MSRSIKHALAVVVPTILLALTPAVTSAAGPVFKSTTTVSIQSGSVAPGGAIINLTYTCFPGGYGPYSSFGDISMTDLHGSQGFTTFNPTCNDKKQNQAVFVPGSFSAGDAAVNAFVCGFDCSGASKEVRLK
jgi:hypothetical protein